MMYREKFAFGLSSKGITKKKKTKSYSGEVLCSGFLKDGSPCNKKAYFSRRKKPFCGRHSTDGKRKKLPKNPKAAEIREERYAKMEELWKTATETNTMMGMEGKVMCTKFLMMREPKQEPGYLMVFPNFKHGGRKDGFGCPSLSPKSLGPVRHGQLDLPDALTIENYHQFNKVFPHELKDGKVLPSFYELRDKAYADPIPHRHKFDRAVLVKLSSSGGNINVPAFSLHLDGHGEEHRYSYVESRYFYCHQYELLTSENEDLAELRRLKRSGANLQIVGYDAYQPTKTLLEHYVDDSRPFGHELVLYTLLTVEDPQNYPWNVFWRKNKNLYCF